MLLYLLFNVGLLHVCMNEINKVELSFIFTDIDRFCGSLKKLRKYTDHVWTSAANKRDIQSKWTKRCFISVSVQRFVRLFLILLHLLDIYSLLSLQLSETEHLFDTILNKTCFVWYIWSALNTDNKTHNETTF